MQIKNRLVNLLILAILSAPSYADIPSESEVSAWTRTYFQRYAARDDWPGFLAQFDAALAFDDPIAGIRLDSRKAFEQFYFWPDPAFSKHPDYPDTLVLEELIIEGDLAIGRGYFTPFRYYGSTFGDLEPMRFVIWLTWNKEGKIVRQVDWIDYPAALIQAMYCPEE